MHGKITYYNQAKGFGFITPESSQPIKPTEACWFHFTHLVNRDLSPLMPLLAQRTYETVVVSFLLKHDEHGRPQAHSISLYDEKESLRDTLTELLKAGKHALTPAAIVQLSQVVTSDEYSRITRQIIQGYGYNPALWRAFEDFCAVWEEFRSSGKELVGDKLATLLCGCLGIQLLSKLKTPGSYSAWSVFNPNSTLRCFRKHEQLALALASSPTSLSPSELSRLNSPKTCNCSGPSMHL